MLLVNAKMNDTILLRKTAIENVAKQVVPDTQIIKQTKNQENGATNNN